MLKGAGNDPKVRGVRRIADHRVRLAGAGLTVGEDGAVVSGKDAVNYRQRGAFEDVALKPLSNGANHTFLLNECKRLCCL